MVTARFSSPVHILGGKWAYSPCCQFFSTQYFVKIEHALERSSNKLQKELL